MLKMTHLIYSDRVWIYTITFEKNDDKSLTPTHPREKFHKIRLCHKYFTNIV